MQQILITKTTNKKINLRRYTNKKENRTCIMHINMMRCMNMQETNIVKEIKLGETRIKFCNDYIAKEKEEREKRIREFKQASIRLMQCC